MVWRCKDGAFGFRGTLRDLYRQLAQSLSVDRRADTCELHSGTEWISVIIVNTPSKLRACVNGIHLCQW